MHDQQVLEHLRAAPVPGEAAGFPRSPPASGRPARSLIAHIRDRPGHDRRYAVDSSKILARLKFRAATTLTAGLAEHRELVPRKPSLVMTSRASVITRCSSALPVQSLSMMLLPDLKDLFQLFHPASPRGLPAAPEGRADDTTIVTGFFNFGRDTWGVEDTTIRPVYRRSVGDYIGFFGNLAKIRNRLVIFIDENLAEEVLRKRLEAGSADQTVIFTHASFLTDPRVADARVAIKKVMTSAFHQFVWRSDRPEYNSPDYVLVNALKCAFVCAAIELQTVQTPQAAWVDFGYCRDEHRFDASAPWRFDSQGKMNLFHIACLDALPIFEVVRQGRVYFQGCHMVGPVTRWPVFRTEIDASLRSLMECDLIDDDQTLILMAWRRNPEAYAIHAVDPSDWFVLFRRFNSAVPLEEVLLKPQRTRRTPLWLREAMKALGRSWRASKAP